MCSDHEMIFLLENLTWLMRHQVSLIAITENELELLWKEMDLLNAFLREASTRRNKSERLRDREKRITIVVRNAYDTICNWKIEAIKASRRNVISRLLVPSFNLAKEVKSFRERHVINVVEDVTKMVEEATAMTLREPRHESPPKSLEVKPRLSRYVTNVVEDVTKMVEEATAMTSGSREHRHESPPKPLEFQKIVERIVIGFEDAESIIFGYLQESTKKTDVISIIGLPGLGKTTLAWKIFKSDFVKRKFPNRIWVYVARRPNIRNVILTILKELIGGDMSALSDPTLIETAQQYLKEREVFIVLDDVWTESDWNNINVIFSKCNKKSKVLITSRVPSVGVKASQQRDPYNLPHLTNDKSWELLQYEVFGELGVWPRDLEYVGKNIAARCDRLPLSLVVIGRILSDERRRHRDKISLEDAWYKVRRNVPELLKNDKL